MVIFKELRITSDGNNLFIDASIAPYDYFQNMYIKSVSIDTEETFLSNDKPSGKAVMVYNNPENESIKNINLNLGKDNVKVDSLSGHIFYIYVQIAGVPSVDTPCSMDKEYTIGVALNWFPIYQSSLKILGNIRDNCCSIPKSAINFILRLKSFELLLRTSQYLKANKIYRKWFSDLKISSNIKPCNCN